mmetsp:Transcript_41380/g.74920  ORF Transcript_41380/g.74920 Transcript_41380/m.74920 type:complete len:560 (-) Transcript_41380:74-1753(-)
MATGRAAVQVVYFPSHKIAAFATDALPASLYGHLEEDDWREGIDILKTCLERFSEEPLPQPLVPCCRRPPSLSDQEADVDRLSEFLQTTCKGITEMHPAHVRWFVSSGTELDVTLNINVEVEEVALPPPKDPCLAEDCNKPGDDYYGGYCSSVCRAAAIVQSASETSSHKKLADDEPLLEELPEEQPVTPVETRPREAATLMPKRTTQVKAFTGFNSSPPLLTTNGVIGHKTLPMIDLDLEDAIVVEANEANQRSPLPTWLVPLPEPVTTSAEMVDPRTGETLVGVVGFYFQGTDDPCDVLCQASFLSNHFDLDPVGMLLEVPRSPGHKRRFRTSEAAYQATKFWHVNVEDFETASAEEAQKLKKDRFGNEDWSYGGTGSNWHAMLAVLRGKFDRGSRYAEALVKTEDAFLLNHYSDVGKDKVWSDNAIGDGANWLGMQLMLVRDELMGTRTWTDFVNKAACRLPSGKPRGGEEWQEAVLNASEAVVNALHKAVEPDTPTSVRSARSARSARRPRTQEVAALPTKELNRQEEAVCDKRHMIPLPPCFAGLVSCNNCRER